MSDVPLSLPFFELIYVLFFMKQALPIFLDALLPAWGAILISVTLILAFGEVISHEFVFFFKKKKKIDLFLSIAT